MPSEPAASEPEVQSFAPDPAEVLRCSEEKNVTRGYDLFNSILCGVPDVTVVEPSEAQV